MYRKSLYRKRYERKAARCAAMREAKARKRETLDGTLWARVWTGIVGVYAHEDGRHVGIYINGRC